MTPHPSPPSPGQEPSGGHEHHALNTVLALTETHLLISQMELIVSSTWYTVGA